MMVIIIKIPYNSVLYEINANTASMINMYYETMAVGNLIKIKVSDECIVKIVFDIYGQVRKNLRTIRMKGSRNWTPLTLLPELIFSPATITFPMFLK